MNTVTTVLLHPTDTTRRHLRLGAHLLVMIAGIALLLSQKVFFSSSILLAATLLAWFTVRRPGKSTFWEIVSFAYLIFFFADWFFITRSLAPSLVHLFIFIIINKLFNLLTERDYYQLYLLTFLSMLAATSLSVEIEMLYMIIFYILLLVWNIMSLTLVKTWSRVDPPEPFPFSLLSPGYWAFIGLSVLVTVLFALGIFFILPRTQLGYLAAMRPGQSQHVSGFSQKVTLGDIAEIQEGKGEVMRIRASSSQPLAGHRFYWRGIAFDRYDGKSWRTSNPGTKFLFQDSSNNFYATGGTEDPASLVKQEVYMAPLDSLIIFGQDRVVRLEGNFFAVTRDNNGTLNAMGMPGHYTAYSKLNLVSPDLLRSRRINYSESFHRTYTQLTNRNPGVERLAVEIATGKTSVYDRVAAVQRYLETNYRYTTTDLPLSAQNPVSEFLFVKKAGHCEYFATSMVVLLRHLGIPSRLVNGFLEGEFNEIGEFYIVRQSDAHSWVEVYFGDGLWLTFDPSPREIAGGANQSIWTFINPRKILDSISFFWDRYILIFSAQDQLDVLDTMRERYRKLSESLRSSDASPESLRNQSYRIWKRYRRSLVYGVVAAMLSLVMLRIYSIRRKKNEVLKSPVLFYQEMLLLLQQKGFSKTPAMTPAEFVEAVGSLPQPAREDISSITSLFYKARFGNYVLTRDDQVVVQSALSRLEQMK